MNVRIYLYIAALRRRMCMIKNKRLITGGEKYKQIAVLYRISDVGYPKEKPSYINNENCLRNAVQEFPLDKCKWHIIADNVSAETLAMIYKYVPQEFVECVSVGHGAGTFRMAYEYAINNYNDNTCVYFLENDYLHKKGSLSILKEGLELQEADYVTLYDNPDKYGYDFSNILVYGGETTRVFLTKSCHWKVTNSTTMTFASSVKILRKDKSIFWKWTQTNHPFDFQIFLELKLSCHRCLVSSLPGYSTHGETKFLSPLTDWKKVNERVSTNGMPL